MGWFANTSYRKFVLILCLWILAFSGYFLWGSRASLYLSNHLSTSLHNDDSNNTGQYYHLPTPPPPQPFAPLFSNNSKQNIENVGSSLEELKPGHLSPVKQQHQQNNPTQSSQKSPFYVELVERAERTVSNNRSENVSLTQQLNSSRTFVASSRSVKPVVATVNVSSKPEAGLIKKVTWSKPNNVSASRRPSSSSPLSPSKPSLSSKNSSPSSPLSLPSSANTNQTSKPPPTKLLCVHFTGRLGNELFEYASTLGLALTLNRIPVFLGNPGFQRVLKTFSVSPSSLSRSELETRCKKAKGQGEESCCKFRDSFTKLDPNFDYRIGTYLQSYKYFDDHSAEIRQALTFNDNIRAKASAAVKQLREKFPKSSVIVGVHIRHGDMASDHNQRLGYPVASPDYINKSLEYFSYLYPNCSFVVASDSVQWCKDNFPKGYEKRVHFLTNEPAVDMAVLSSLDHVVTSFGSFSWWIGYFSKGKVVYMRDFIRANTFIGKCFHPKGRDYVYPGWIPL